MNKMPIKSLVNLSKKQKALWERIFKEQKAKGKSEALSAKIAWGVVKKASESTIHEKSHPIKGQIHAKSINGKSYLEGYIFTFDVDEDNEAISPEFAERIASDLTFGGLYHDDDENDLLKIEKYSIDDKGMFALVEVNKDSNKYESARKMMVEQPEDLAFSVRFASTQFGKRMVKGNDGIYHSEIFDGRGVDFCLTDIPINKGSKAKPL